MDKHNWSKYQYAKEDLEYLQKHNIKWFWHYNDLMAVAKKYNCKSVVETIKRVYQQKRSLRLSGIELGWTGHQFYKHAKRLGIKLRGRGGNTRKQYSFEEDME